jgi:hypothetical protein
MARKGSGKDAARARPRRGTGAALRRRPAAARALPPETRRAGTDRFGPHRLSPACSTTPPRVDGAALSGAAAEIMSRAAAGREDGTRQRVDAMRHIPVKLR